MGNIWYFSTRLKEDKSRTAFRPIISKYIQNFIWDDKIILELACWYWDFINNIKAKSKNAIDIYENSIKYLNKDVEFISGDLSLAWREQSYNNKYFDVIFASNFLEHLDDNWLDNVMMGINKIIKNDWLLIIVQPNYRYMYKDYFDDYTHKKVFTHVSLIDFLESNWFKVIHCEKKFLPWTLKKNKLPIRLSTILLKIYFKLPFRIWWQMFLISKKKDD